MSHELEPVDWQERHSPTVEYTVRGDVRVDGTLKVRREVIGVARRRHSDARLFDSLGEQQQKAMQEIERAHKHHVRGLGVQARRYDVMVSPGVFDLDAVEDLLSQYMQWREESVGKGIDVEAVMSIVVDGFYPRTVDRARQRRHGWARDQLDRALDLWINWKRPTQMLARAAS